MSTTQFFQVLLQAPLVIGLAFGALALSLGLALLLGSGRLSCHISLARRGNRIP